MKLRAAMIPEQLSLFGGPPKPPKVIRQEEPAPAAEEALPAAEAAVADEWATVLPEQPAADATAEMPATTPMEDEPVPDMEPVPTAELLEQPADAMAAADVVPAMEAFALEADAPVELPDADPFASTAEAAEVEDWAAFEATWQQVAPALPADEAPMAADEAPWAVEDAPVQPTLPEEVPGLVEEELLIDTPAMSPAIVAPAAGTSSPAIAFEPGTADSTASVAEEEASAVVLTEATGDGPQLPPDEILFKRQYYSMRETAGMFGISHSMLRYWENEFDVLQPRKNRKGDRYFRPIDIKNLHLIYNLLKVRKFTMDGAREYLRHHNKALDTFELVQKLEKLKTFLNELKATL